MPALVVLFMAINTFFPVQGEKALDVSWCESRWQVEAQNEVSTAAGPFQIIDKTWEWARENGATEVAFEEGRYDPVENTRVASWLVHEGGGWGHWDESAGCWA